MAYPPGLQRTHNYTQYAKTLLQERLGHSLASVPSDIPFSTQVELERIVDQFYQAWVNQVILPYRLSAVQSVLDSTPKNKEAVLRRRFPGPFPENSEGALRLVTRPTAFVDLDGRVVGWYFPTMFTKERSEHVYDSVRALSHAHKSILVQSRAKHHRTRHINNWRDDDAVFRPQGECELAPGNVNMSICWYNLGHGPRNERPPAPSASLAPVGGGPEFIASETDTNALIGVILSLVHPDLFDLQVEVLTQISNGKIRVRQPQRLSKLFEHWSTPFTAFALISNRETPFHRDTKGGKMLLDLLATFGRYTGGRLEIPLFGARFVYNPGAVALFPGHLMEHGAGKVDGERVCMAYYFRPNVGYGVLSRYKELSPPTTHDLAERHRLTT